MKYERGELKKEVDANARIALTMSSLDELPFSTH